MSHFLGKKKRLFITLQFTQEPFFSDELQIYFHEINLDIDIWKLQSIVNLCRGLVTMHHCGSQPAFSVWLCQKGSEVPCATSSKTQVTCTNMGKVKYFCI